MTTREFLTAVADTTNRADIRDYALAALAKAENRNERRRNTQTKAQLDNAALLEALVAGMTADSPVTSSQIAKEMGLTTQKASALLALGVKSGMLKDAPPVKGKSGKVKAYVLA